MLLKIKLSEKAIKDYFIRTGVMYDCDERWVEITFEPKEL